MIPIPPLPSPASHRSRRRNLAALPVALALASTLLPILSHADWPQWRGPGRDGVAADATPWPTRLDAGSLTRRWHVPLGPSYSGPLIVGDKVFVTEARNQSLEAAIALDRATGKEVWRREWEGYVKVPFFAKSNGDWIRSTPAYAEGRLFVGGMRDLLVALDAATGRELWRIDFPKQLGKPIPDFGLVCSPLATSDAVYVQAGAGVARVEAATGRVVWHALQDGGGMWGSAFSSPILARIAGEEQLVVQTRDQLAGLRPSDGKVLWAQNIKSFRGMNILTPVVSGDRILTSSYGGQTQGWTVKREGETWKVAEDWHLKLEAYMSTPVVIDGVAYLHTRAQKLAAVEIATGRKCWETDQKFGKYQSLVTRDQRVLALDQRGELLLFEAKPDAYHPAGTSKLSDAESWAHLAVSGSDLVVREQGGVTAWNWIAAAKP